MDREKLGKVFALSCVVLFILVAIGFIVKNLNIGVIAGLAVAGIAIVWILVYVMSKR